MANPNRSRTKMAEAKQGAAPKKARSPSKPRTMYFVTAAAIDGNVHVVKDGDSLVALMDAAQEKGEKVHYRKVSIPAGR